MKIIYGKNLTNEEHLIVAEIARKNDILFDTARLLFYRNIDTPEKAKAFLSPGKHGFFNPMKLKDMEKAVARIKKAKENNESVLVFGDYDADGICATTVLYNSLKEFGIIARTYVPEREEGYGLNVDTVRSLNADEKIDLLITVDCGISDYDKIDILKKEGVDVIVTDHHEPPNILPDCIKINPKIEGQDYPFDGLCGAGVAFKLGSALIGEEADKYLDYVALATVADSMDLVSENRDIVVEGLKLFNGKRQRLQFQYLLSDPKKEVTSQTLAYMIAPRINAGGRMGDARAALNLFLADKQSDIFDLAVKLNSYNIERQAGCDNIYRDAKAKISNGKLNENEVILVSDEKWQVGFIGIVAARLVEDYSRPVIVFAGHDGYLKGSARSVEGINIYDAVSAVQDLTIAFGGHSQAAGVAVEKDKFLDFSNALNEYVKNLKDKPEIEKKFYAEWNMQRPPELRFAREINELEPFGVGNRRPVFTTEVFETESIPLKPDSPHFSFRTETLEMLDFNGGKNVFTLSLPVRKKVVFEINLSVYKNRESLKGYVRGVYPEFGDFSQMKLHIFHNEISKLKDEQVDKYNSIIIPENSNVEEGTLYVVSDPDNIKKYSRISMLAKSLFEVGSEDIKSSILVSPSKLPSGYLKVVYLDKPMQVVSCDSDVYVCEGVCGYKVLDGISTDREAFKTIFSSLMNLQDKPFKNVVDFSLKHFEENAYQAVFCLEVFVELGIFYEKNRTLKFNEKIKNALTNSKVYSKIYSLKG